MGLNMQNLPHANAPWRLSFERNRVYIRSDMKDPRSDKESLVVCQVPVRTKGCDNTSILLHAPGLLEALERIANAANKSGMMWVDKDSPYFDLSEAINDSIDIICKAKGI